MPGVFYAGFARGDALQAHVGRAEQIAWFIRLKRVERPNGFDVAWFTGEDRTLRQYCPTESAAVDDIDDVSCPCVMFDRFDGPGHDASFGIVDHRDRREQVGEIQIVAIAKIAEQGRKVQCRRELGALGRAGERDADREPFATSFGSKLGQAVDVPPAAVLSPNSGIIRVLEFAATDSIERCDQFVATDVDRENFPRMIVPLVGTSCVRRGSNERVVLALSDSVVKWATCSGIKSGIGFLINKRPNAASLSAERPLVVGFDVA